MCSLVMSLCSRDIITIQWWKMNRFNLQKSAWFLDGRTQARGVKRGP